MSNTIMTLDVETDGQTAQVVEIKPRTVLQWEKFYPGRSGAQLDGRTPITYLYELAWLALGKPGEFAAFGATTDVTYAQTDNEEESGPDPTQSAPSTESS